MGKHTTNIDVVIVGAGASGIYAAKTLKERGVSVLVLEATERIGTSITESIARMWGSETGSALFERVNGGFNPVAILESNQVAIKSSNLTPGSTVATESSNANLVAPTF
jgi:flavin-dependent dehydrogenase